MFIFIILQILRLDLASVQQLWGCTEVGDGILGPTAMTNSYNYLFVVGRTITVTNNTNPTEANM